MPAADLPVDAAPREEPSGRALGARASVGVALAVVIADPVLWLLGSLGFLARGGLLLLALPILALPSLVELTTLLGPDAIGGAGLSARLVTLILVALAVLGSSVLAGVVCAAFAEAVAFERVVGSTEIRDDVASGRAGAAAASARPRLVLRLVWLQLRLLPVCGLVVGALALRLVEAVRGEYFLPRSLEVPFVIRVVQAAAPEIALVLATLVAVDLLGAVASRRVLVASLHPARDHGPITGAVGEIVRRPWSVARTFCLAWLVSLAAAVPVLLAVTMAWRVLIAVYAPSDPGSFDAVAAALVTVLFVAVWLAALLLLGVASALRGTLWTLRAVGGGSPAGQVR